MKNFATPGRDLREKRGDVGCVPNVKRKNSEGTLEKGERCLLMGLVIKKQVTSLKKRRKTLC